MNRISGRFSLEKLVTTAPLPEHRIDRLLFWRLLLRVLRSEDINIVVDAGANRGQSVRRLRSIGFTGWVVSFEPSPSDFMTLSKNFQADDHWIGHQVALGDKDEEADFHVQTSSTEMSSLLTPIHDSWPLRTERVRVRRLDHFSDDIFRLTGGSPRIFLKMDTQGFDLNVFRGSTNILDNIRALSSELSLRPSYANQVHWLDALRSYEEAGFQLVSCAVADRSWVDRLTLLEADCLMVRQRVSD